ncbi:carboxypeptidase regulatory-like domain-containing protein [Sphingobacterium sp. Ag1]|uniref:carboxypeptidase regulatory-like domain-containing protein n=1 Tax=Sphingobacterium sp. Ag1 TaxID=1643451 RepID=UPI000AF3D951|nr:carboxypeptidase regulatory-like domain-containing protein [Sphingobacterium sp. Ag1]
MYKKNTKILLKMKLSTFMTLFGMLQISFGAIGQNISLSEKNSSLAKVFKKISTQTGYGFLIEGSLLRIARPVTIETSNTDINLVLAQIFKNQPLSFVMKDQSVIVSAKSMAAIPLPRSASIGNSTTQQQGYISGRIINENGEVLADASITLLRSGQSLKSKADGSYSLNLAPGTYTIEVSYISHQTKRITDIVVQSGKQTNLNIVLKSVVKSLEQVVVTGSYKQESVASLYAKQKNEATISNGISREQIAVLPDKNVGETLKRISGVSTNDNRRVVIRGIAERYNLAMMDGATLPSTDVQVRDFEFDIVPSNLIDNVIIHKTSSPDLSFGFGGGLVQINTLAIPVKNFTSFSVGSKYINGSTGKDFLGYGRGSLDYLAFDDGTRGNFPRDLTVFDGINYDPANPYKPVPEGVKPFTPEMIAAQNERIGGLERLGTRKYTALPGQNYQFSLGRSYSGTKGVFGFVGSLSYRNEQSIDHISNFERGNWQKVEGTTFDVSTGKEIHPTTSTQYNFNSSLGALVNLGWNSKNHKITSRNFYSRMFNNQFSVIEGWGNDIGYDSRPAIREYDRPKFIDMLQNKLDGEHRFGNFKLEWNIARNQLNNREKDATEAWLAPIGFLNDTLYNVIPSHYANAGDGTFTRSEYHYKETNKIAEGALSYRTNWLGQKQTLKAGYQYMDRHGLFEWVSLPIVSVGANTFTPVNTWSKYLEFTDPLHGMFYYPAAFSVSAYEGKNINQAVYGLLDNRFNSWIRLVWGVRAEYFKYKSLQNGDNDLQMDARTIAMRKQRFVDPKTGKLVGMTADPETEEKTWRYLPSVSLTLTPIPDFNIRMAYSQSVVRPALIENSKMVRQDPALGGAYRRNEGVLSTLIDHYDMRFEWYPSIAEVISIGFFYKYFQNPIELYRQMMDSSHRIYVTTNNSEWAKVKGLEFDIRKNLGFMAPGSLLEDFNVSGNITLQSSEVQSAEFRAKSIGTDKYGNTFEYREKQFLKSKRPLYGQIPVVYNAAIQYAGDRLGANVAFNHMGYKTFMTAMSEDLVEYERPRNQLDAQLSYKLLKNKNLDLKLNLSNLLNSPFRFYVNRPETFKVQDRWKGLSNSEWPTQEWDEIYEWKFGFSQKYEEGYYETSEDGTKKMRIGDKETFNRKVGSSFSLSIGYTF